MAMILHLIYLACLTSAQNITSDPAQPAVESGWQSSPGRRGTLDIILGCAATVFACTWSINHLNVPGPNDGFWTTLLRSAKWMAITVLLPEFILAHAVFELDMARNARKIVNAKLSGNDPNRDKSSTSGTKEPKDTRAEILTSDTQGVKPCEWTLTHCYFANMGGLYYQEDSLEDTGVVVRFPLTAFQYADHHEALHMPALTEAYIKDKGKQDAFAKIVAMGQILYLFLSIGVRRQRHLPYTQLEVITLAFAVCGIATYGFYWYKPQNVKVSVNVTPRSLPDRKNPPSFQPDQERFWNILTNHKSAEKETIVDRIYNDNIPKEPSSSTHTIIPVLSILSVGFSCIHLIAWNFQFPTHIESVLWKSAILVSIIAPALALAMIPVLQITKRSGDPRRFISDCCQVLEEMQ